jgi:hypothetical protein
VLPDRTYRWLATLRETGIPLFAWAMALIFVAELVALIVYVALARRRGAVKPGRIGGRRVARAADR